MNSALKLREVIWEINARCNKNCTYCGSKGIIAPENELSPAQLCGIAKQLSEYEVNEVTLSGGEPGIIEEATLKGVIRALRPKIGHEVVVKAVTNGTLLTRHPVIAAEMFDRIGLSINSIADCENAKKILKDYKQNNITFITNFGKHNWFEFTEIRDFFLLNQKRGVLWQVQLTTGNDFLLPPGAIDELRCKLSVVKDAVLADCLQVEHECTAGLMSCGILWDGSVVGCLSERTYIKTDKMKIYGCLVGGGRRTLKDIWETEFRDIRFDNTRKSCRDCIKYPKCTTKPKLPVPFPTQPFEPTPWKPEDGTGANPWSQPIVVMYAVSSPSDVPPNHPTFMYGVTSTGTGFAENSMNTLIRYGVFGKNNGSKNKP